MADQATLDAMIEKFRVIIKDNNVELVSSINKGVDEKIDSARIFQAKPTRLHRPPDLMRKHLGQESHAKKCRSMSLPEILYVQTRCDSDLGSAP